LHVEPPPARSNVKAAANGRGGLSMLTAFLCWLYAATVLTILVLIRFTGERWWPATVLLFSPRWIWIAPLAVLIPMALLVRRRLVAPALVAAVIVLFGIMDFRLPWRRILPGDGNHRKVSIFTCNIHGNQADTAALNEFVNQTRPDIIVMQDYTTSRRLAILREGLWHTRRDRELYIASRYPMRKEEDVLTADAKVDDYARDGLPIGNAVCYAIDSPAGPIHLVNLHLASPHIALGKLRQNWSSGGSQLSANSGRRGEESQTIRTRARQIGGPFILAGDFNTPDDSPMFKNAWGDFQDAFSMAGLGFGTTYAKHHTWLRIDHVLADPGWRCVECQTGADVGSGHHPVFAVFEK
jgi:vancomycin resistance protein VanJ